MKKLLSIILALLLILSLATACGKPEEPENKILPTEDGGVTYADPDYYPIVAQPISLTAAITELSSMGDLNARTLWAEMEELTGIRVTLDLYTSDAYENIKLMFASRDYPDISFKLETAGPFIVQSIELGDIVEITDEMLKNFAPNWEEVFKLYPELYTMALHTDGKLYNLPHCLMSDWDINLRDCWLINSEWLDELGMNQPQNLDQFTDYLRAVKRAAGTGSIPSGATPLLTRNFYNIGGWYTIADTFGLYNGINDEIVENGVVKHNAQNPLLKEVAKYLNQLYKEGLINSDFASLNWNQYCDAVDYTNTSTQPWTVGSYFAYSNNGHEFMTPLPMLKTNSGADPVVRPTSIYGRFYKYNYVIYANNKYPVASLRFADYFGSIDGSLRGDMGVYGVAYDKDEQGAYRSLVFSVDGEVNDKDKGFGSLGPAVLRPEVAKQLSSTALLDESSRVWAYYNVYEQFVPDEKVLNVYPTPALDYLTQAERDEITEISNAVFGQTRTYMTSWINGKGNPDADWDALQNKLVDLKIGRLLELQQKAYDLYIQK